jgi:hypothetical protein
VKFRFVERTFEESMATTVEVKTTKQLVGAITKVFMEQGNTTLGTATAAELEKSLVFTFVGVDSRINWTTYAVRLRNIPVGLSDDKF